MQTQQAKTFPVFPVVWTPQLLRRCTTREILIVVAKFGLEAVAQRLGEDGFVEMIQKIVQNAR